MEFHIADEKDLDYVTCPLNDLLWHHVAAVRSGRTASIYLDGELGATKSNDLFAGDVSFGVNLTLGSLPGWGKLAGMLDEVRLYRRALSAEEITARCTLLQPVMTTAGVAEGQAENPEEW